MQSLVDKQIVLSLNRNWQRLGFRTIRQALIAMNGGAYGGTPPALALDIETDENGKLISATPQSWEEWTKLPVRPQDLAIETKSGPIRAPLVIIVPNYSDMPLKGPKLTSRAILQRDGLIDQYSGEKLTRRDATLDHVIPKSKGGKNSWENLVTCHRRRNTLKGNRLNEEIGLKLIRKPRAPQAVPACALISEPRHAHHVPFLDR